MGYKAILLETFLDDINDQILKEKLTDIEMMNRLTGVKIT